MIEISNYLLVRVAYDKNSGVQKARGKRQEARVKINIVLYSLFPVPCSLFPVPCSLFPEFFGFLRNSQFPKLIFYFDVSIRLKTGFGVPNICLSDNIPHVEWVQKGAKIALSFCSLKFIPQPNC